MEYPSHFNSLRRIGLAALPLGFATAEEAVRRFPSEKPDVALVDIKLPGMDGIECIRRLRQIVPALSTHFRILLRLRD